MSFSSARKFLGFLPLLETIVADHDEPRLRDMTPHRVLVADQVFHWLKVLNQRSSDATE